jgi:lambda repressor-like predicted transcriptional regulator
VPDRADFKTKIIAARGLADGLSIRQAAVRAGVNPSTLCRWQLAQEPEFMEAAHAVAQYDELHAADEPVFPNVYAGVLGEPLMPDSMTSDEFNHAIREAAGR